MNDRLNDLLYNSYIQLVDRRSLSCSLSELPRGASLLVSALAEWKNEEGWRKFKVQLRRVVIKYDSCYEQAARPTWGIARGHEEGNQVGCKRKCLTVGEDSSNK